MLRGRAAPLAPAPGVTTTSSPAVSPEVTETSWVVMMPVPTGRLMMLALAGSQTCTRTVPSTPRKSADAGTQIHLNRITTDFKRLQRNALAQGGRQLK